MCDLLSSAATNCGSQISSSTSQSSTKVCNTGVGNGKFFHDLIREVAEEKIDFDTGVSTRKSLARMTSQSPNAHMTKGDCSSLTPEVREIWSKIPNETLSVILRGKSRSHNKRVSKHNKDSDKPMNRPFLALRNMLKEIPRASG